jgi:hypothetical protein
MHYPWIEPPFERLGRNQSENKNAKEDRTTEALASCLDLSLVLRAAFLQLLKKCNAGSPNDWTVQTQVYPRADSRWDLVLSRENGREKIVVECKIDDHLHRGQIAKYFDIQGVEKERFYVLVQDIELIDSCAVDMLCGENILRWQQVDEHFSRATANLPDASADRRLALALHQFLLSQGTIVNYSPSDFAYIATATRGIHAAIEFLKNCEQRVLSRGRNSQWWKGYGQAKIFGLGTNDTVRHYPTLIYVANSSQVQVRLEFRIPGVGGWTNDPVVALNCIAPATAAIIQCLQTECPQTEYEQAKWQYWVCNGPTWRSLLGGERTPADLKQFAAYCPLVGFGDDFGGTKNIQPLKRFQSTISEDDLGKLTNDVSNRLYEVLEKVSRISGPATGEPACCP